MKIKSLLLAAALLLLTGTMFAQSKLYEKYSKIKGVQCVYIPDVGSIISMANKGNSMPNFIKDMGNIKDIPPIDPTKITKLLVISTEDKNMIKELSKDADKLSKDKDYELMLDTRDGDGDEMTSIYKNKTAEGGLLIINKEDNELQIIQIFGNFMPENKK